MVNMAKCMLYTYFSTIKKPSLKDVFEAANPGHLFSWQPLAVPVEFAAEAWGEGTAMMKEGRDPGQNLGSGGESSSLLRAPKEAPTCQEGDLGGMSFNTKGCPSPPWELQGEATLCPQEGDLRTETPSAASRTWQGSDSANRRALRRERRKMIERDLLHKVTWGARNPVCSDQSPVKKTPCESAAAPRPRPGTPPQGPREGVALLSLQVGGSSSLQVLGACPARGPWLVLSRPT